MEDNPSNWVMPNANYAGWNYSPLDQIDTIVGASEAFIDGWKIAYIAVTGFTLVGLLLAIMTRPGKSVEGE